MIIDIPSPPAPPFDPPWRAIKEWIHDDESPDLWDQRPTPVWLPTEIQLDDERTLVLEFT